MTEVTEDVADDWVLVLSERERREADPPDPPGVLDRLVVEVDAQRATYKEIVLHSVN